MSEARWLLSTFPELHLLLFSPNPYPHSIMTAHAKIIPHFLLMRFWSLLFTLIVSCRCSWTSFEDNRVPCDFWNKDIWEHGYTLLCEDSFGHHWSIAAFIYDYSHTFSQDMAAIMLFQRALLIIYDMNNFVLSFFSWIVCLYLVLGTSSTWRIV